MKTRMLLSAKSRTHLLLKWDISSDTAHSRRAKGAVRRSIHTSDFKLTRTI